LIVAAVYWNTTYSKSSLSRNATTSPTGRSWLVTTSVWWLRQLLQNFTDDQWSQGFLKAFYEFKTTP